MDVIKIIFGGEMMIVCHAMAHTMLLTAHITKGLLFIPRQGLSLVISHRLI